jgi:hypothetical protein
MTPETPNTIARDIKDAQVSIDEWYSRERNAQAERLQKLGIINNWKLDDVLSRWIQQSEDCYIMGFYYAAAFFAGASLEVGMRIKEPTLTKNNDFCEIITLFNEKGLFDDDQTKKAHRLRKIRNEYGHSLVDQLAQRAVHDGIKVQVSLLSITEKGENQIPEGGIEIIDSPKSREDQFIFLDMNAENVAWAAIKDSITLLMTLFPVSVI